MIRIVLSFVLVYYSIVFTVQEEKGRNLEEESTINILENKQSRKPTNYPRMIHTLSRFQIQ